MTATTIRVQMAQRKDTAANWTAANPILLSGEIGYETDTKKFKIGDGTSNWNTLAYLPIPDGSGNLTITGNLEIGTTGSLTFEGSTANAFETTLAVTDPTADRTITLPDRSGTVITSGDTGTVSSTMLADGTIVNADISATAEIAVSKLANGTANQVLVTDGTDVSWSDNLTLAGNLTVNGTTTTIDSQTLLVEDKNIEMGVVATPTDATADGGGITLRGTTNKTINWIDSTDSWTSSENVDLASGKSYRINNTEVLSSTTLGSGVTGSSLTSVGTIGTGVWQGTAINATYLDSTLVKTSDTGTVTSTMIADGTIVNADVNASAAIAGTKISPNFGSQNVTTTGTSTAASFIPSSSTVPTNGLYLSATNSVALSTGGTGRLFIDSSGNVGIGAASFGYGEKLGVGGTVIVSDGTVIGRLTSAAGTAFWGTVTNHPLAFQINGNERFRVRADGTFEIKGGGTAGVSPAFSVNPSATSNSLVISSTGLVGIGTSSPTSALEVNGTITIGTGGTQTYQAGVIGYTDANWGCLSRPPRAGAIGAYGFQSFAGTTRMVITDDGKVGIGTASPSKRFTILQDGADSALRIEQSGEGYNFYRNQANGFLYLEGPQQTFSGFGFRVTPTGGSTTNAVWIDNSGRVGIGNTAPNRRLEISDSNADNFIRINTSGAFKSGIEFSNSGTAFGQLYFTNVAPYDLSLLQQYTTGSLILGTNNTERARIDSSGRLLVGTSSSQDKFFNTSGNGHLVQLESSTITLQSATAHGGTNVGAGAHFTFARSRGTAAGSVTPVVSGDNLARLSFQGADGTEFTEAAAITCNVDTGTVSGSSMPGRLVFSTTSDGQASPTERLRITSTGQVRLAGAGITFNGDTATANELDDYEEGTWTPTVAGGTTAGTATYSTQVGNYTKVGRQVTLCGSIVYSGGTGTGTLNITNFPFTSANITNNFPVGNCILDSIATAASSQVAITNFPNTTYAAMQSFPIGGGTIVNTSYDAAGSIYFQLTYFTS